MENMPISLEYSFDALMGFLDYLSDKGLVNKNTIISRRASCNKMLSILDPSEASDLRSVDLDELAVRFNNLKGTRYSPQSLQVYKSRVGTALADFIRFKENPANFKVSGASPKVKTAKSTKKSVTGSGAVQVPAVKVSSSGEVGQHAKTINIPIPLRSDCVVQINGLPVDLTSSEAKKIAAVVQAMGSVYDG